jgi:hypothetical protein
MEDLLNFLLTKLELNMEQDIVMLNVLRLPSLMAKLPLKAGVIMERAVLNLIFGRRINKLKLLQVILAEFQVITDVKGHLSAEMTINVTMGFVIRTDVELILIVTEINNFMDQVLTIILIVVSLSQ